MKSRRTLSRNRKAHGVASFIEIIASALFIIILALFGMDICMAIFGATMNDHACRDAARAASGASPAATAQALALTALKAYPTDGHFITTPQLVGFDYHDFGGNPPADTSPYVSVTTKTIVSIPAPIFFFGATFIKDGKAQFLQQYTFPIVKSQMINFPGAS